MSPFSSSLPPSADKSSRLSFQEYMQLVELPAPSQPYGSQHGVQQPKRYMSQRASWMPGIDLPSPMREQMTFKGAAYGGHVYSQSGLAASKAFAEMREELDKQGKGKQFKGKVFGIHTIHGYFSEAGLIDRPFIYEVTPVSTANLAFANFSVTARQPQQPTSSPSGDHYPLSDAINSPMGPICFTALVSFRPTSSSQAVMQEDPPQSRFAHILDSRPPHKWEPAPLVDIDRVVAMLPPGKKRGSGSFPCVDMKKVDMRDFNRGKPLHERRELILYRRILSPAEKEKKKQAEKKGQKEKEDPDAHILTHAFEADRNGLLMCGNHVGFGSSLARAATLSYSFVVHHDDDVEYTVDHKGIHRSTHKHDEREEEEEEEDEGGDEWWIQEATFPRVEANRCVVLSKIWSPQGKHVATEYQDGIIQSTEGPDPRNSHRMSKL
ncbi:Acyl-coenzyme A thioesterase 8 [Apiospora aurea]|uniref:Acyl-coenzyme A thioesterase 8 n=1 Tax=Apiospora aurea TaxID=335848 RepID=A0ABR1QME4_9PEZI